MPSREPQVGVLQAATYSLSPDSGPFPDPQACRGQASFQHGHPFCQDACLAGRIVLSLSGVLLNTGRPVVSD
jgi:hypothetical protein